MEFPKSRFINLAKRTLPVVIGAAAGYAYYYFIGCVSGACPITSKPWMSTGYGALMGLILTLGNKKPATESSAESK